MAFDILHVTVDAASRLQRLQLERGAQALSRTKKAIRALSAVDPKDALTVQAGLTQCAEPIGRISGARSVIHRRTS